MSKFHLFLLLCLICGLVACSRQSGPVLDTVRSGSDLSSDSVACRWDEGIPLGNGIMGALVWKKHGTLRFSIDRSDLWDLRPVDSISGDNYSYSWVREHIRNKDYRPVQRKFDDPYNVMPAPSKIPGAALEFPLNGLGRDTAVYLSLQNAVCRIDWDSGVTLQSFVHATRPVGWFVFRNVPDGFVPDLVAPVYRKQNEGEDEKISLGRTSLQKLGYVQGKVGRDGHRISYRQEGYGNFHYDAVVQWKREGSALVGVWSITSSLSEQMASKEVDDALRRGLQSDYREHMEYWNGYWNRSSVILPDEVIQKQYDNEMYKFGSAARENSYPISLQAVWTADNGKLPPWKGDYHHDLNTELSYWPAYTGNHLQEGLGFVNTLWSQRETFKKYTHQYFGTSGMNVPGVCTLTGEPMGGWIQYAMSPTIGAWVAQHFYLHWKYSGDRDFLKRRCYPFLKDVATHMEEISILDGEGNRTLEFSSSPEMFDNSLKAWFTDITNFDLALMKFIFGATAESARTLGLEAEAEHWKSLEEELPGFSLDKEGALVIAKGFPYNASHRHFSHALAIHPLGLIDPANGEKDRRIIEATLDKLEKYGPSGWVGYSYSWAANLYARAADGEKAAAALRTFATCFCLKNTFHANGDQSRTGKSGFTYRPFTLEGNFAFAAAVQEMLLQSHTGILKVFPAIPEDWKNVSFQNLRAMGAFLVSARMKDGKIVELQVLSEKGNDLKIVSPLDGKLLHFKTRPGERKDVLKWIGNPSA